MKEIRNFSIIAHIDHPGMKAELHTGRGTKHSCLTLFYEPHT